MWGRVGEDKYFVFSKRTTGGSSEDGAFWGWLLGVVYCSRALLPYCLLSKFCFLHQHSSMMFMDKQPHITRYLVKDSSLFGIDYEGETVKGGRQIVLQMRNHIPDSIA